MAAPVLRGLESKPKLNGRTVKLVEYHQDRGRWEVELDGELPPTELFQIDWNDDWWEPCDGESESFKTLCSQKGPTATFKEELDGKLRKLKLLESTAKISAVDCNGRNVCVFISDGSVLQELQKQHIPRKVDTPNEVCQRSFPLHFQRKAVEGKTLAIRPSSLNVREDDSASRLRQKKVEMCVGILHRKPELDGQVGLLGPFQAHTNRWEVLPDARGLWDVKVDGSATAVQLSSSEIRDEASGDGIADPIRVGMWPEHDQERALYANVAFRQGQIIMEEEPALVGNTAEIVKLMQQSKKLSPEQREQLSQLSQGADFVRSGRDGNEKVTEADFLTVFNGDGSEDSRSSADQGLLKSLFSFMRTFVTNSFWHHRAGARGLYLQLARVNHSCRPNAIVGEPKAEFDAKRLPNGIKPADPLKKALIAIRDIQQGEEITISYLGDDELLQPSHIRREMLESSYGFNCTCHRCIDEDDDGLLRTFRCANCGGGMHAGTRSGPRRFPSVSPDLWSVGLDHDSGMSLRRGRTGDAVAWGSFQDAINSTGWAVLDVHTTSRANGNTQSYAAGYLEGALTHTRITQHLQNMWGVDFKGYATGTVPQKVRDFVSANMEWMVNQVKDNPSDNYWVTVGYLLAQLHGLADGYEAARDHQQGELPLTVEDMLMLVMVDTDMDDVVTAVVAEGHFINEHFLHRRHKRRHRMFDPFPEFFEVSRRHHGHCSALVQVAPNFEDLWVSHATWDEYRGMLRIIKYFDMPLPGTAVQRMAFTADPGGLYSADDFYVLDSQLVVMETTIDNYNRSLWSNVKPETLMTWARTMVANRLSTNGAEWTTYQVRDNSGTCNNQWMVVDYKRFVPGSELKDGVLWISETMPGHSQTGDVTHVLRNQHSWPSYNIPFFTHIWKVGGYEHLQAKSGSDDFSFEQCPRAKMFERARKQGFGNSLESLMALIRYNRLGDPLALGDACNAISARCDLNPQKHVSYDCFGAIDAKVASWRSNRHDLSFLAVSSPTHSHGEQPFAWSRVNDKLDGCKPENHIGHPATTTLKRQNVAIRPCTGLAPCNACGSPAADDEKLVAAEQEQERIFADHCKMISEKRKDPKLLVDMAKICAEIGLAPNHWLLCKVHHMQACFFAQAGEASRAVESLAGILHLHEKVFGSISLQKTELLGDQLLQQGDAVKAFDAYISVLKVLKLRSPNTPPSDEHCERIRQKLREWPSWISSTWKEMPVLKLT
ncbi:Phospholipase B-like protein B [Symbiodinium microadriaticum]|uniref:Phospholipase B-like protein B n=1 Tax=Symbiodinium microadriaticum TaxID=2951 RepID=A0A1Q9DP92_SYMMI|nr:Phospholipase B-like protein B [Symbiodinium microadriaticum]